MGIELEEERIFEKLRRENPDIIADGVVDETEFLAARYRIVYILKEANGGKGWDLRDFVYDGGRPQTWDNIARWTEGILSWEKEHPWAEMEQENEARRLRELKKIAAINLKKTSGSYISDGKQIYQTAGYNRTVIKEQLSLYHADFIICCGTEDAFMNACYKDQEVEWKMTSRGVWYFLDGKTVVISFAHPEARVRDAYLFYAILDAVREIEQKKFLSSK